MTNTVPFTRKYRIESGTMSEEGLYTLFKSFSEFHFAATITNSSKGSSVSPNENILRLYNIDEETRQSLSVPRSYVKIFAGWESLNPEDNSLLEIYAGYVKFIKSTKTGVDVITEVYLDSSLYEKKNWTNSVVNEGATLFNLVELAVSAMRPLDYDIDIGFKANIGLPRGKTLMGNATEILDKICRSYNLAWYVDKQTVYVVDRDTYGTKEELIEISLDRVKGYIDYAKQSTAITSKDPEKVQANLTIQLDPTINLSDSIIIPKPDGQGGEIDGTFKITTVTHNMSYYGNVWDTQIEAQEKGEQ